MKPTVYLAGKMTGLSQEEMTRWRKEATEILQSRGFTCLDPTQVPLSANPSGKEIVSSNKYQISHSDIVLAEIDHDVPSLGTVGEIIFANQLGKPVIAWGRAFYIATHPWVEVHSTTYYPALGEALDYIVRNYGVRFAEGGN